MVQELYIATNNGDIGGGEVMLLNIARRTRRNSLRLPPMRGLPVWCFPPVPVPST